MTTESSANASWPRAVAGRRRPARTSRAKLGWKVRPVEQRLPHPGLPAAQAPAGATARAGRRFARARSSRLRGVSNRRPGASSIAAHPGPRSRPGGWRGWGPRWLQRRTALSGSRCPPTRLPFDLAPVFGRDPRLAAVDHTLQVRVGGGSMPIDGLADRQRRRDPPLRARPQGGQGFKLAVAVFPGEQAGSETPRESEPGKARAGRAPGRGAQR